jgi:hypothetical protein
VFRELVGNWSKSSFPYPGLAPLCLNVPIWRLGVKFPSVPALRHWEASALGVDVTQSLSLFFI